MILQECVNLSLIETVHVVRDGRRRNGLGTVEFFWWERKGASFVLSPVSGTCRTKTESPRVVGRALTDGVERRKAEKAKKRRSIPQLSIDLRRRCRPKDRYDGGQCKAFETNFVYFFYCYTMEQKTYTHSKVGDILALVVCV